MQLKDAIQEFILECKVRRLVPRTIDNYGKHLRYLTVCLAEEYKMERKEKLKQTRQFMNYYLPTTIKLLEQYVQLQNVGMKGENIENGMRQIEDLLDKVIVAFQKQLDSLFERDVIDITADIQVMEQMMAGQGLTESDF